jgi:hypothetical protein
MNDMSEPLFDIGAPGVDTEAIVKEVLETVERKRLDGVYSDPRIARAERSNLLNLKGEEDFLPFFLDCLKDAVFIDINDFEIFEKRRFLGKPLVLLKKTIWKLMKFYTYRLWSQQNQVNGLLLTATESIETRYRDRMATLEQRVADLEKQVTDGPSHDG